MFFGFFKRKKKETEVQFDDIKEWLVESEEIKDILDRFNNEAGTCFSQISKSSDGIEPLLKKLEEVNLENRRDNPRIKAVVLQNKTAYVEHVRRFLDKLKNEVKVTKPTKSNEYNLETVEKFVSVASEQLNSFSKQSFKAFHITSELIGREIGEVVNCIKAISSGVERLKIIEKEKVKAIELIRSDLRDVTEKERVINNLKAEIENKQKEEQRVNEKLSDIEKKNEEIKISSAWKKKQDLIKNTSLLNEELKSNSTAVLDLFLSIEKALKKWSWKEKNNKVLAYLEKPLILLKQDSGLGIIEILNKVKEDIIQNKLDFDEKRKDRLLKNISAITKEKIASFIEEEENIKRAIQKNEQEVSNCSVELIDNTQLTTQKNGLVLEIVKVEKRKSRLEQDILNKKSEIRGVIKTIPNIKLIG